MQTHSEHFMQANYAYFISSSKPPLIFHTATSLNIRYYHFGN